MTALAIMQLLPAQAGLTGTVRLRGAALTAMDGEQLRQVRGRDIGMVFQEPMTALNPLMSIGNQVAETVRLHRSVSRAEARRLAREALDQVGLDGEQGAFNRCPTSSPAVSGNGGHRHRRGVDAVPAHCG